MTNPIIISATREDNDIFRVQYHYKDHSGIIRVPIENIGWEKVMNDIVNLERKTDEN